MTAAQQEFHHVEKSIFVQKAQAKAKLMKRRKERGVSLTLMATVALIMVLAGHLTYQAVADGFPQLYLNGLGKGQNTVELSKFSLAGVSPGMTPAMVKRVHKSAIIRISDNGRTMGYFAHRGADVRTWHLGQANKQSAYRIRARQTFPASAEQEVLGNLAVKFGRPIDGNCDISAVRGNRDCHFSWRTQSIDLQAKTEIQKMGNGQSSLRLTLTAEDVTLRRTAENSH